jgi:hypothetical protein
MSTQYFRAAKRWATSTSRRVVYRLRKSSFHLIEEWNVKPVAKDYRDILEDSLEGFARRRTDR